MVAVVPLSLSLKRSRSAVSSGSPPLCCVTALGNGERAAMGSVRTCEGTFAKPIGAIGSVSLSAAALVRSLWMCVRAM